MSKFNLFNNGIDLEENGRDEISETIILIKQEDGSYIGVIKDTIFKSIFFIELLWAGTPNAAATAETGSFPVQARGYTAAAPRSRDYCAGFPAP